MEAHLALWSKWLGRHSFKVEMLGSIPAGAATKLLIMLKVGDYVGLKPKLVLGRKYGTVTFGRYHVPYLRKTLRVYKISSANTAYCNSNGYPCECGTFSESMLNVAKYHIGDIVKIADCFVTDKQQPYVGKVSKVKSIEYKDGSFVYHIVDDCGFFDWPENTLELLTESKELAPDDQQLFKTVDEKLEDLKTIPENENRLQEQKTVVSDGARVKGSRVLGRLGKTSVRSRPLRNPQRIRGK